MPLVRSLRVVSAMAALIAFSASWRAVASASLAPNSASTSAPCRVPASTRKMCRRASTSSVSARSNPAWAGGPVCIDAQKQVGAETVVIDAVQRGAVTVPMADIQEIKLNPRQT